MNPKDLKEGDTFIFHAAAQMRKKELMRGFRAIVFEHRYGSEGEYSGIEAFIMAEPGTFKGAFSEHSLVIDEPSEMIALGIHRPHRIHYRSVLIPKELFPHVFEENGRVKTLGSTRTSLLLGKIINPARRLRDEGTLPYLSTIQFSKTELQPPENNVKLLNITGPKRARQSFNIAAKYDITLEGLTEVGLLSRELADKLTNEDSFIDETTQRKLQIIRRSEKPIGPLQTAQELETLLRTNKNFLKAVKGFNRPKADEEKRKVAWRQASRAISGFNAAAADPNIILNAPFASLAFEIN